jgi:hypothetical protein
LGVELEVAEDLPRDARVGDEGDGLEPPAALGTGQHVAREDLLEQLRPGYPVLPYWLQQRRRSGALLEQR